MSTQTIAQVLPQVSKPTPQPLQRSTAAENKSVECPECDGAGWYRYDVPVGHPQFGRNIRCGCKRAEDVARLQRLSGLTASEQAVRLDDIVAAGSGTKAMVSAAREFVKNPYGFLTIHGTTGNAKTTVLQGVVNELVDGGVEAVYVTAFDLLGYIRKAFNASKDIVNLDAHDRLKRLEVVRVLCIDELDKVRWTEFVEEQITDLIDARYRLGIDFSVGTVIAMNADPETLPSWIYRRLRDGRNKIVKNADPDVRPNMEV